MLWEHHWFQLLAIPTVHIGLAQFPNALTKRMPWGKTPSTAIPTNQPTTLTKKCLPPKTGDARRLRLRNLTWLEATFATVYATHLPTKLHNSHVHSKVGDHKRREGTRAQKGEVVYNNNGQGAANHGTDRWQQQRRGTTKQESKAYFETSTEHNED